MLRLGLLLLLVGCGPRGLADDDDDDDDDDWGGPADADTDTDADADTDTDADADTETDTDTDTDTDPDPCVADIQVTFADGEQIEFDGCEAWEVEADVELDPDDPPAVGRVAVSLNSSASADCGLAFEVQGVCGPGGYRLTDGATLSFDTHDCSGASDGNEGSYTASVGRVYLDEISGGEEPVEPDGAPVDLTATGRVEAMDSVGTTILGDFHITETIDITDTEGGDCSDQDRSWTALAKGHYSGCGIDTDGKLTCWGCEAFDYGQCGPPSGAFTSVTAGQLHYCALDAAGDASCWGYDTYGESSPPSTPFKAVALRDYSCGITLDTGAIECWGNSSNYPHINDPPDGEFVALDVEYQHGCAIDTSGEMSCWGCDGDYDFGQCDAPSGTFTSVSAGPHSTCGIETDGSVSCWGCRGVDYGQCDPPTGTFIDLSVAQGYGCGVRENGLAVCWGESSSVSDYGELDPEVGVFEFIDGFSNATCGLRPWGAIDCWGDSRFGSTAVPW